jgi:hypothetical protein
MKRRRILMALALAPIGLAGAAGQPDAVITVYKDPG